MSMPGTQLAVAEVVARAVGAADDGDVARIDGGLNPADLTDFADAIGAGRESGEAVGAAGAGDGRGIDGAVGVLVELDRPAGQARIGAAVVGAVAVDVVELLAADRAELEVAEVVAGAVGAADDGDVARVDGGLNPADLADFADAIGAGRETGEAVGAAGTGDGRGIDGAVGVLVEFDRPASQTGIGAVVHAVAVVVLELLAAERAELEVAEVVAGELIALDEGVFVVSQRRVGVGPTDLDHFLDLPRARVDAGDRVAAVGIGDGERLVGVHDAVVVVVDVDRPAREARLARLARCAVGVQVFKLHAALGGGAPVAEVVAVLGLAGVERDNISELSVVGIERIDRDRIVVGTLEPTGLIRDLFDDDVLLTWYQR